MTGDMNDSLTARDIEWLEYLNYPASERFMLETAPDSIRSLKENGLIERFQSPLDQYPNGRGLGPDYYWLRQTKKGAALLTLLRKLKGRS